MIIIKNHFMDFSKSLRSSNTVILNFTKILTGSTLSKTVPGYLRGGILLGGEYILKSNSYVYVLIVRNYINFSGLVI